MGDAYEAMDATAMPNWQERAEKAEALVERFRAILGRASRAHPCLHCAGTGGGAAMGWTSLCPRCMGSAVDLASGEQTPRTPTTPTSKESDYA